MINSKFNWKNLILPISVVSPWLGLTVAIANEVSNKQTFRHLIPESDNNSVLANKNDEATNNSNLKQIFFKNSIIINDLLVDYYDDFNNRIFQNAFKNKVHFSTILPKNSSNEIIIMPLHTAKHYFPNEQTIALGLNISNTDYTELEPLPDYCKKKWERITSNIFSCFINLGAKKIVLRQKTNTTVLSEIEVKKIKEYSVKFGMDFEKHNSFDFERTVEKANYNPELAKKYVNAFKEECNLIYRNAMDAITTKPTGSLKFSQSVDMKFKLSLEVLGAFHGGLKGGFMKEFDVIVEF